MKHRILLLLVVLATVIPAYSYDFAVKNEDGVTIYYYKSGSNATVTYKDKNYGSYSGNVVIPSTVTYNGTTYTVTSIDQRAFCSSKYLTAVTLPNSVTSIGELAFYKCSSLTSVTIPNAIKSIGNSAFGDCSNLKIVNFNATNCTTMSSSSDEPVFQYCSSLTTVNIGSGVTKIPEHAFQDCSGLKTLTIPNSVTSIGAYAFSKCSSLTSVTIPASVTSIGGGAFYWSGLESLRIEDSKSQLNLWSSNSDYYPFRGCFIENIYIGRNLSSWSALCFYSNLKNVEIGDKVTSIERRAFYHCTGITEVTIPTSIISIGECTFEGCSGLTTVNFNATNCTTMGSSSYPVFKDCTSLINVNIGESVGTIPQNAFYGCSRLRNVYIPNSVKTIKENAFWGCSKMKNMIIGNSVISIGTNAFMDCLSLVSVKLKAYNPPILSSSTTFPNNVLITVPYGCANRYKNANYWSDLNIQDIEEEWLELQNDRYKIAFSILSGNTVRIEATNHSYRLRIPQTIEYEGNTYTVAKLGDGIANSSLQSVEIPSSVTNLGTAFKDCLNLRKVTFLGNTVPEGINQAFDVVPGRETYVSTGAYQSYSSVLGNINVYTNLSSMFDLDGVTYIPVPAERTAVAYDCDYLTPVITVPSTVTFRNVDLTVSSVAAQTFRGNQAITSFNLGGNVPAVGVDAFTGCTNLKSITLQDGEPSLAFNANLGGLNVENLIIGRDVQYTESPFKNQTKLKSLQVIGYATRIGANEFAGCVNLTSLGTAGTVNSIEASAFKGFAELTDVSIDGTALSISNEAFMGCTKLNNVTIEGGVNSIGNSAFKNCTGMKKLVLNNGVAQLGNSAFEGCTSLNTLTMAASVSAIGNRAFYGCRAIQSPVRVSNTQPTTIGSYAFYGCTSVPSITVGNGTTTIGASAFENCSAATTISLGNNVTSIGNDAFKGCSLVSTIALKNNVATVGSGAFMDCTGLTQVSLPSSLTTLGSSAFRNCSSLPTIAVPASVTVLNDYTFSGCSALNNVSVSTQLSSIGAYTFANTPALDTFEIPVTVTAIGAHAFDYSAVQNISLPNGVQTIEEGTFANTASLAGINLNQVQEIKAYAFADSALPTLTIPASVQSIADGAFDNCTSLAILNIASGSKNLSLGKNAAGEGMFKDCKLDELYIGRTLSYSSGEANGFSPFYGNTTLKNVSMGEKAIAVPENMFAYCTGLENVNLGATVTSMGSAAFKGSGLKTINFPSRLTIIPTYAFSNCKRLTDLQIPATITRIDKHAFEGSGLQNITLPATITNIDEYVLANTKSLQSVQIADGTTTISSYAFSGSKLPALTIPNSVTNIANAAFSGCDALAELTIADGTQQLSLGNNASNQGLFYDCALTSLYQGRDLKYSTSALYGTSPFYASRTLRSVEIGDLPTKVESKQFYNCSALTDVKIGDSVSTIGDYAFSGCSALETFEVGASIEEIGMDAFSDCTAMVELRTYAPIPPYCGDQALSDIDKFSCTLYVPDGAAADYQAADQWNEFFFVETFEAGVKVSYIELSETSATMNVGETMQLTATAYPESAIVRSVDWTSSAPTIADVNAQGIVTAYAEGQVEITATAKDGSGATATCTVTVFDPEKPVPYSFALDATEISKSRATLIPVSMKNEEDITSFQCDIYLPEGLTLSTNEYGDYDITRGPRLDSTFVIASADLNGAVRVAVYSIQNHVAQGNEGVIFYLPVEVNDPAAVSGKEYTVRFNEIAVVKLEDFSEIVVPSFEETLVVGADYTPGDVNNDGKFSISDASMLVSFLLGRQPANGIRDAADVNCDGRISVSDASILVSYVLTGKTIKAPARVIANESNLTPTEQSEISINANGNLILNISNLDNYISAQADITLPHGLKVKGVRMTGSNVDTHAVQWSVLENGDLRIVSYSPYNGCFRDGDSFVEVILERESSIEASQITVHNILMAELQQENNIDIIAEVAANEASAWIDLSGVDEIGSSNTIIINGNAYEVNPDKDGKVIFTDTQGRVYRINVLSDNNSIELAPGIYLINNKKIIVK